MINVFRLSLLVLAALVTNNTSAEVSSGDDWLLIYTGKSTNELIWDDRLQPLIHRSTPKKLYTNLLDALSGPPDPVVLVKDRFISMSACVAHYCPMKGFFWIDIKTRIGLGAIWGNSYDEPSTLQLASNEIKHDNLPLEARQALIAWLSEHGLHPKKVAFVEGSGKEYALAPNEFRPSAKFTPPSSGPSFDCQKARGIIEKTICNNKAVARLDLLLSNLFNNIKSGHAIQAHRKELIDFQRSWIENRNKQCSDANDVASCLDKSYREQYEKLRKWLPERT